MATSSVIVFMEHFASLAGAMQAKSTFDRSFSARYQEILDSATYLNAYLVFTGR
jgi:hypothetical protein